MNEDENHGLKFQLSAEGCVSLLFIGELEDDAYIDILY